MVMWRFAAVWQTGGSCKGYLIEKKTRTSVRESHDFPYPYLLDCYYSISRQTRMTGQGKNEHAGDSYTSIPPPTTTEEQEHSKWTWDFFFYLRANKCYSINRTIDLDTSEDDELLEILCYLMKFCFLL